MSKGLGPAGFGVAVPCSALEFGSKQGSAQSTDRAVIGRRLLRAVSSLGHLGYLRTPMAPFSISICSLFLDRTWSAGLTNDAVHLPSFLFFSFSSSFFSC